MKTTVGIIATLDTKGNEVAYLKQRFEKAGQDTLVIDSGTGGQPQVVQAEVPREAVAGAAGSDCQAIAALGRGDAVDLTRTGLIKIVRQLFDQGKIHGLMTIGGYDGALMAATAMHTLPVGVPKLIVTPVAQGQEKFGPFTGFSDVTIMHSVVDILGLNQVSRKIYNAAAGAMVGMVEACTHSEPQLGRSVAVTMYGNTTPVVMAAREILDAKGYEVVVFHPNGTGGRAMERMIRQGLFVGVLDMTTHEITDRLFGGLHAGADDRMEAAGDTGTPQVVVPGCVDFMIQGPVDQLSPELKRRKTYHFNPLLSLVKVTAEEMDEIGRVMAAKLNRAQGPTKLMVPLRGLSMYAKPGQAMFDPEVDAVLLSSLKKHLSPAIALEEVDMHINDPEFAAHTVAALLELMPPPASLSEAGQPS
jgi:uncharacterized protein (UPF0261 family)